MIRLPLLLVLLMILLPLVGQNQLDEQGRNQLDEQGRKTGLWVVEYPNGRTLYEATFVAGKPVGEMVRYYENGGVRARMMFDSTLDRSYTRLYYTGGKEAAEGWYVEQKKDSVWTYYSEFDGSIRIREPYVDGKLNGIVTLYYSSGEVSEEVTWKEQKKQGAWIQYYTTGHIRLRSYYEDDQLNGPYEVFYSDGTPKVTGENIQNESNGTWTFYNESGEVVYALEYLSGQPLDQEKYKQWVQDSLSKYEILLEPESIQQY